VKKKSPFNQEMAIRGANRRLFARSPLVTEKLNESRQEFPRFKKDGSRAKKNWVKRQCEVCLLWVGSSHITIDHKDPVVPPEGFPPDSDMWDRHAIFMKRLWCDKSNLQRICDDCHNKKTQAERIARLLTQYHDELQGFEMAVMQGVIVADWKKYLAKYIAKKKTLGLESVVERAKGLKYHIEEELYGKHKEGP
jgi:hypothetical protein